MNDLVVLQLDKANIALREAKTIQETKSIADVAQAAEIYAKRQKLGEEAVNYAYSIKIDALAKLGRMLKETERNQGALPGKTGVKGEPVLDATPTLAELGLTKKESSIAQKLASLPEDHFQAVKAGTESMTQAIKEVEESKPNKIKVGPPCNGMMFARMAVAQLERIKPKDSERPKAFDYVKGWIKENE